MKGLISNLTTAILQYETSARWQRRFFKGMISRSSHLQLRRMARTLAKLVVELEAQIDKLHNERTEILDRGSRLEDEIDRLEEILKAHGIKDPGDDGSLPEAQSDGGRSLPSGA